MRKIIVFALAVVVGVSGFTQTVTNDAESGDRAVEQAQCWEFGAVGYTSTANLVISGRWSMRGNSLSNPALTACWIKSPWIMPASGKITLRIRMENTTGSTGANEYKRVTVRFQEFDPTSSTAHGAGAFVGGSQEYTLTLPVNTLQNIAFEMPEELVKAQKPVKVMFSFSGVGGNNRPSIDDIVIPGKYYADPSNKCLPSNAADQKPDKDGDGVIDEDDAYPEDPYRAFNNYLPSKEFNTLMFEDLWPGIGDFDFNDLVVDYRINRITNAKGEIVDIEFTYKVRAIGAAFRNGLAVEFTDISPEQVYAVKGSSLKNGVHKIAENGLEAGTKFLTFVAFDNAFDLLPFAGGGVVGVNTTPGAPKREAKEQTIIISLMQDGKPAGGKAVSIKELGFDQFNPFLVVNQTRGREVHLADKAPTALADMSLFGTSGDASSPGAGRWYKTKDTFLPWAINVAMEVPYPAEKVPIEKAYPYFSKWVQSNGNEYAEWYIEKYRNEDAIYK